jgi:hypothetical protein
MKRRWAGMMLCFVLMATVVAGCQTIHVADTDGDSLFWAKVELTDRSGEVIGLAERTDSWGNTYLYAADNQEEQQYLYVSKNGYVPQRLPRVVDSTVEIILQKKHSNYHAEAEE